MALETLTVKKFLIFYVCTHATYDRKVKLLAPSHTLYNNITDNSLTNIPHLESLICNIQKHWYWNN